MGEDVFTIGYPLSRMLGNNARMTKGMLSATTRVSRTRPRQSFRVFALAAFDYDTLEPLFIAGQGRDNLISTEDVVIRDTVDKFRKQLASR